MVKACNILIVGGEGDLALRKLYPALYSLDKDNLLATQTRIICFGRGRFAADEFKDEMRKWADESVYIDNVDETVWIDFVSRVDHFIGDATNQADLSRLKNQLGTQDLVIYLSTPPSIFAPICNSMGEAGLVSETTRMVLEKPLGESQESFDHINNSLFNVFDESQLFRIDHYLGKETVQNLLALRFSNIFFEPLWNRHYVDHVQITVAEDVGVGGRWNYYNDSGALRDMVQNHLLQLLCLVAMEHPAKNRPDDVRDEKLKVLRCLKPIDTENVGAVTVRGQYVEGAIEQKIVPAYNNEVDAAKGSSDTETFVAIKAEIENNRWQGVPFYLRTGKRLAKRYSEIVIQFKPVVFNFLPSTKNASNNNRLVIRLQPNEGIELKLMNKVPGLSETTELQNVGLNLSFDDAFEEHRSPSAYERLLLDVTRNDQTLFMRSDELRAAWKWVDGIIEGWQETQQKADEYSAGSWGPDDALALMIKDGRKWLYYEH